MLVNIPMLSFAAACRIVRFSTEPTDWFFSKRASLGKVVRELDKSKAVVLASDALRTLDCLLKREIFWTSHGNSETCPSCHAIVTNLFLSPIFFIDFKSLCKHLHKLFPAYILIPALKGVVNVNEINGRNVHIYE